MKVAAGSNIYPRVGAKQNRRWGNEGGDTRGLPHPDAAWVSMKRGFRGLHRSFWRASQVGSGEGVKQRRTLPYSHQELEQPVMASGPARRQNK